MCVIVCNNVCNQIPLLGCCWQGYVTPHGGAAVVCRSGGKSWPFILPGFAHRVRVFTCAAAFSPDVRSRPARAPQRISNTAAAYTRRLPSNVTRVWTSAYQSPLGPGTDGCEYFPIGEDRQANIIGAAVCEVRPNGAKGSGERNTHRPTSWSERSDGRRTPARPGAVLASEDRHKSQSAQLGVSAHVRAAQNTPRLLSTLRKHSFDGSL